MARRRIKPDSDQRPFIMVYQDFLESDVLDNYYQKLVYIYLKKFADSDNKCFPSINKLAKVTGISKSKVAETLFELEEKGVLAKENRFRPDGGKTSNLYTLYDFKELWKAKDGKEVKRIIGEYEDNKLIEILESKGYKVIKEKELEATAPTKVTADSSTELNQYDIINTTLNYSKSQALERYTLEQIKMIYDYNIMVGDNPHDQADIDIVISILYESLNTTKETIRVSGEDKPTMVVIGKLMRLTHMGIMYAIEKFREQTDRIKNPKAYMLTLLYGAEEQMRLDMINRVQHDQYGAE